MEESASKRATCLSAWIQGADWRPVLRPQRRISHPERWGQPV